MYIGRVVVDGEEVIVVNVTQEDLDTVQRNGAVWMGADNSKAALGGREIPFTMVLTAGLSQEDFRQAILDVANGTNEGGSEITH